MTIHNITRGITIADQAVRAASFLARGRGLMLAPPLAKGGALVIEPCNSIHMFFMRYPLDVIFLDENDTVLFMYKGIKPWRMGRVVRYAKCAVELPEGTIAASRTEVGDKLQVS
ncbi:MAG: DUF192 domain-containing protein [Chloroflexota bacterium]